MGACITFRRALFVLRLKWVPTFFKSFSKCNSVVDRQWWVVGPIWFLFILEIVGPWFLLLVVGVKEQKLWNFCLLHNFEAKEICKSVLTTPLTYLKRCTAWIAGATGPTRPTWAARRWTRSAGRAARVAHFETCFLNFYKRKRIIIAVGHSKPRVMQINILTF